MISFKKIRNLFRSATARLALSYLAIIMLMSIGFSTVFFFASAHELGRPPRQYNAASQDTDDHPHIERDPLVREYLEERAAEGRHVLLIRLVALNVITLAAGGMLSYYLARRTLEPIEANMEAQAQFVSDASHELRTPLTALQTTNEVALRKPKLPEAAARELIGHNVAEVAKLQALTDGLLRLARQDGKDLARVPVSLQAISSDAINAFLGAAQDKRMAIEDATPDLKVLGDQPSLARAVGILLDNAIKYSPEKSKIIITGSRSGKHGLISVTDHGQGIATRDLPHIFDRFYRADQSRTSSYADGYGIGLALAKKIVHQHDGEIVATSTPGKGSIFTISLPLA